MAAVGAGCGSDTAPVTVSESESGGEAGEGGSGAAKASPPLPVTRNTSRIEGSDAAARAAEVALATHPRFGGEQPIEAVAIAPATDWQAGVAAASLAAAPLNLPILLSESGSVPGPTEEALEVLEPEGGSGPADAAVYSLGEVALPAGLDATPVEGDDPATLAAEIDKLRQRLTGTAAEHVLLVSEEEPGFAMPAAAWAARSGDPVLFVGRDSVPAPTLEALNAHKGAAAYILGPESVISEKALSEVEKAMPGVRRIAGEDPVTNAIEFARYSDSSFGWNITDPGHGLVVANTAHPADAGAAASLSAGGSYGPLLLTEEAEQLPAPLAGYLQGIKPGYSDDPTRALYNHVWLIGGADAISGPMQAEIDELAELVQVGGAAGQGTGAPQLPSGPVGPEAEPAPQPPAKPDDTAPDDTTGTTGTATTGTTTGAQP